MSNKAAQLITGLVTAGILAGSLYLGYKPGDPIITNGKNNKYSFSSWKRQSLLSVPCKEFDSSEIIGGSFYQNEPYTKVFPDSIEGVKFINCNLDNCIIPPGATVIGGTNKHFKVMNDQEYWIVDKKLNPIIPRDTSNFRKSKVPFSPDSIPKTALSEPITVTNDPDRIEQKKINFFIANPDSLKAVLKKAGEI